MAAPSRREALVAGEPRATYTAEQALLAGVLERAMEDLKAFAQDQSAVAREQVQRIREWFDSTDNRSFSFLYICDHLDLSPDAARRDVQRVIAGERP